MNLRERLLILRRSWLILLASALIAGGAGAAYTLTRTPVYEAQSRVFVSAESALNLSDLSQGSNFLQQVVKSYASVVSSPIVLDRVIAQLGLRTTSEDLAKNVRADAPLDTVIVEITADDPSPVRAARIADAASAALSEVASQLTPGTANSSSIRITRIESAAVPKAPVSPQVPLTIGLAVLLGLVLGGIIVAVRERLDIKVRGESDIEALTEVPVIGTTLRRRRSAPQLLSELESGDPYIERYKSLITKLRFVNRGEGARSIAITSSVANEGKTTTVADLGEAFAATGRSVVVVDADLRRPALSEHFGLDGSIGLTDLLTGSLDLEHTLQTTGRQGLQVLPAGEVPPNPAELLDSDRMGEIVQRLQQRFDVVLFDTAPTLVTDAAVLAQHTGGLLMVSAVGRGTRPGFAAALHDLTQSGVNVLGIVVTMLPPRENGYAAYRYASKHRPTGGRSKARPNAPGAAATP